MRYADNAKSAVVTLSHKDALECETGTLLKDEDGDTCIVIYDHTKDAKVIVGLSPNFRPYPQIPRSSRLTYTLQPKGFAVTLTQD